MYKLITKAKQKSRKRECSVCGRKVNTEQGLKAHMTRMHSHTNPVQDLGGEAGEVFDLDGEARAELKDEFGKGVEKETELILSRLQKMVISIDERISAMEGEKKEILNTIRNLEIYLKGE